MPRKASVASRDGIASDQKSQLQDGYANLVANLGSEKDKASAGFYFVREHNCAELEAIYRGGWIGRKIVDIPTDDMTRRWRSWELDQALIERIEAAEKKFQARERVTQAIRWGRLFGSSAIVLGVKPRLGTPDQPLDIARMQASDLLYLHVAFSRELQIEQWEEDPEQPGFGQPVLYRYMPQGHREGGTLIKIHASRVIPFCGVPLPPFAALRGYSWGDSVFTSMEQTLMSASSITAVIASLVTESKVDVITVAGLTTALATAGGERKVRERFQLAAYLKSVNNAVLLGENDKYDQKQIAFAGLSDVHIRLLQEVSGAADIPVTRLLGQSPAGMSATGESDSRNYYDMIAAKQETDLRPRLDRLDAVLFASEAIVIPQGKTYTFAPLWQESPAEKATIALQKAQATAAVAATGLIDDQVLSEAVVSQLQEDETYPGLNGAVRDAKAAGRPVVGKGRPEPMAPAKPAIPADAASPPPVAA